jgi:hypothetical protein
LDVAQTFGRVDCAKAADETSSILGHCRWVADSAFDDSAVLLVVQVWVLEVGSPTAHIFSWDFDPRTEVGRLRTRRRGYQTPTSPPRSHDLVLA